MFKANTSYTTTRGGEFKAPLKIISVVRRIQETVSVEWPDNDLFAVHSTPMWSTVRIS